MSRFEAETKHLTQSTLINTTAKLDRILNARHKNNNPFIVHEKSGALEMIVNALFGPSNKSVSLATLQGDVKANRGTICLCFGMFMKINYVYLW